MILRFILAPFLVPEITNSNWGVFKDAKQKKQNKEMQVTLTWLMLGSLVSNIWKTGAGSVCWSTWSSCWGWPHTAMALVRWSTPLSNSPGLGKKQVYRPHKQALKMYQGLKLCRESLHQCSHSYSDMSGVRLAHAASFHVFSVNEHVADLVLGAPLPAGFPPRRISGQLLRPSSSAASKSS